MSDKSSLSLLSVNTDGAGNSMHLLCIDGLPQNFVNTKQYTCQQLSLDPSRLKHGKKLMERVQWFERASFNKIVPMYSRTWIINLNNLPKCVKKSSAHQQNLTGLDFCEANLSNQILISELKGMTAQWKSQNINKVWVRQRQKGKCKS